MPRHLPLLFDPFVNKHEPPRSTIVEIGILVGYDLEKFEINISCRNSERGCTNFESHLCEGSFILE